MLTSEDQRRIFSQSSVVFMSLSISRSPCFPLLLLLTDTTRKWIISLSYFLHVSIIAADMVIAAFQRRGKCTEKCGATQKATALFRTSSLAWSRALCQQLSPHNPPHTAAHTHTRSQTQTHTSACANNSPNQTFSLISKLILLVLSGDNAVG